MTNAKLNILSVSGLLAAAIFTTSVTAGPTPGETNQGTWKAVDFNHRDTLPSNDTVKAGFSGGTQTVYVCSNGAIPGRLLGKTCYTAYSHNETPNSYYWVLQQPYAHTHRYEWVDYDSFIRNNGQHDYQKVAGGTESGRTVYICKAKYYDNSVVGKYVPEHYGCYFGYNGSEHLYKSNSLLTEFDVLIQRSYTQPSGDIITPDGGGDITPIDFGDMH